MKLAVIIVAAGRGVRAGGDLPKQWQMICGRAVAAVTFDAFAGMDRVLVIHPQDEGLARQIFPDARLVFGGDSRSQSVRNALEALSGSDVTHVLIHDAARPMVSSKVIKDVITALATADGAAPALAVTDALWTGAQDLVTGTMDRTALFRAQTPQGFHFAKLLAAYRNHKGDAADDVEVARSAGIDVAIVAGEEDNFKLTYAADFARAETLMKEKSMDVRVGNGFDVHAFTAGDGVWLCGVKVDHPKALLGHSDADVGMHALTDALYGALAEGDIGTHFPPSDPQWKGAESHIFLRHAVERARQRGYRISNCDVTLICERPKIGPVADLMRETLAGIMSVEVSRISVKATTSEKLGFTGREEGIAAMATATLVSL
ncbi:MAG: bifunctional 2-C-methyl-D-erythritol 4-phosphate cytidylyltransferase/2-C-methyl-D-erythritol 2,4-cyclodiphosphate synthase [Microgenomates group bacterium]